EVEQLHGGTRGRVVAGLSLAAHVALLPSALRPFRARYPHVQLHLIEGWYPTLEAGLKDGSVDFYIGPQHERPPSPELVQELLFENTRVVLGRRGHPLARVRSLRDLVDARVDDDVGDIQGRRGAARAVRTAWIAAATPRRAESICAHH